MADDVIEPGRTYLYAPVTPAAEAGKYTLELHQTLGVPGEQPITASLDFEIDAPRWTLSTDDVHQRMPMPGKESANALELPMIVFRRRTLPWERRRADGGQPWLALILLRAGEAFAEKAGSVAQLLALGAGGPAVSADSAEQTQQIRWLELARADAEKLLPTIADLGRLAHVRRVSTEDKELLGQDEDGWFAAVLCNRIPAAAIENHAFLVSLEGHELGNFAGAATFRYVILDRWKFACTNRPAFTTLGEALSVGMLGGPTEGTNATPARATEGFVPMWARKRSGEAYLAAYCGPLVPQPPATPPARTVHHSADQFGQQANEVPDLSHASAFELGRLLALSDRRFAQGLFDWRRRAFARLERDQQGGHLEATFSLPAGAGAQPLGAGDHALMTAAFAPPASAQMVARARFDGLPVAPAEIPALLGEAAAARSEDVWTLRERLTGVPAPRRP